MRTVRRSICTILSSTILAALGCGGEPRAEPSDAGTGPSSRDAAASDAAMTIPRMDAGVTGTRRPDAGTRMDRDAAEPADDAGAAPPEPPELNPQSGLHFVLPNGKLWGFQVGTIRAFLGIPFATVPQRFAPPQRAEPWSGTFDATKYGPVCPQADNGLASHATADENCLTLDVYTPANIDAKLPVLVFVHGGAFVAGASSQYDATHLAERGLVVVAINYRLGPLGFFSHPALDATRADAPSGSDGIRDQQLALRWVRENIGAFNGDRSRLTMYGESAGAISSCIHWVSPTSRGLAQRFILQSGTCTFDGPGLNTKATANDIGMRFADALCPGQADQLACLRAKSADELMKWGGDMGLWGPLWQPTIDGEHGVLPDYPERLAAKASELAPMIVGTTKNEWGFFQKVAGSSVLASAADLTSTIAAAFGEHADMVQAHYNTTVDTDANTVWIQLITDMSFRCPTRTLARLGRAHNAPVWVYSFEQGRAFHADDLDYVFGTDWVSKLDGVTPPSAALTTSMQRYWTRFATGKDPNGDGDPAWPAFDTASDQYMVLADPPHATMGLASTDCDFWRDYWRAGGNVDLR